MNMNINTEQLKGFGKVGLRIGKSIVVEGSKALLIKGAATVISASFDDGIDGIKRVTLDDVLDGKKRFKKDDTAEEAKAMFEIISENKAKE